MKRNEHLILVALPFKGVCDYVVDAVKNYSRVKIRAIATQDYYTLKNVIREVDPEIVVTAPFIISDPLLPLFKESLEMEGIRFAAYCTTTAELQLLKHYDAKLTISDSPKEMVATLEELLNKEEEEQNEDPLTAREKEVVIAVVKGLTNKEIADRLFLSTHTVITHRKNIARKLNIHSPAGLTVYAIMNKLVDLEDIGLNS